MSSSIPSLSILLGQGADSRAVTDPNTGLNPYYCAPYPMKNLSIWSSCTAVPPSPRGFKAAQGLWKKLSQKKHSTSFGAVEAARLVRDRLREILAYKELDDYEIILSPSGTDAEAIPLAWTLTAFPGPIRNIFMAPLELGQGSALAGSGRYFDSMLPNGRSAVHGKPFVGKEFKRIWNTEIHIRNPKGKFLPARTVEQRLHQAVGQAIKAGKHILLRLVDSSKTGASSPSLGFVKRLREAHPGKVTVLVDAAQGRWRPDGFKAYLKEGYFVLISGSKFFGGPPFCGALLMPRKKLDSLLRRPNHSLFPRLLSPYLTKADFGPEFSPLLNSKHPLGSWNLGLLLRWEAALAEMKAYFSIPQPKREAVLCRMSREASNAVQKSKRLTLVDGTDNHCRSIFTVLVYSSDRKNERDRMSQEKLAELRKKLFQAGYLLGKPVRLSPPDAKKPGGPEYWGLRFALSAPMLVQEASGKVAWGKWKKDLTKMVEAIEQLIN